MNKLFSIALLMFCFVWTPARALNTSTLYQVQKSVASQAADARAEAIREGFYDVLVRLTGDPDIFRIKQLKKSLTKADYYVQEYSYSSPTVTSATYTLNIKFNEADVNRLLKQVNLKPWISSRPLVLVWLVAMHDHYAADIILGGENEQEMTEQFKRQALRYGLPLIFPVMDVTDIGNISTSSIIDLRLPIIKSASRRYQPDALLIGTLENDDHGYRGRWSLVWGDKVWDWTLSGAEPDKIFNNVLSNVSQVLARGQDKAISKNENIDE